MRFSDSLGSKKADSRAISEYNIPSLTLMERAAGHLRDEVRGMLGGLKGKKIAVFCGSGNNGGDGLAAACLLFLEGALVRVFLTGSADKMTGDSRVMKKKLEDCGLIAEEFVGDDTGVSAFCERADLIVDALVGIGLHAAMREKQAYAVRLINASKAPVLSADIPSGVEADTGRILGEAVRADVTVTFSCSKPGHAVEPGCAYTGRLKVVSIGIPEEVIEDSLIDLDLISPAYVQSLLPRRLPLSHKGDYGKVLIVGGSRGYTGAPVLAARAASKTGSGLVWAGVPACVYPIVAVKCDEVMPFPLPDDSGKSRVDGGKLTAGACLYLQEKLHSADVCAIGPGLGRSEEVTKLVESVLEHSKIPLILDADGLNALSGNPDLLYLASCPLILTPHEGEFARLGGDIEGLGRLQAAREFAQRYNVTLVLKGHRTIVAAPGGRTMVNTTGNAGMAKGGSGDVLTGMIASLIGQGLAPFEGAAAAVWMHGAAGDLAAERFGQHAMTPVDTLNEISQVYRNLL